MGVNGLHGKLCTCLENRNKMQSRQSAPHSCRSPLRDRSVRTLWDSGLPSFQPAWHRPQALLRLLSFLQRVHNLKILHRPDSYRVSHRILSSTTCEKLATPTTCSAVKAYDSTSDCMLASKAVRKPINTAAGFRFGHIHAMARFLAQHRRRTKCRQSIVLVETQAPNMDRLPVLKPRRTSYMVEVPWDIERTPQNAKL